MIDAYRRFPLRYQIIAGIAVTALAYFLSMKSDEALIITSGTAVALIFLHLFLIKLNSMLAFIVIAVQGIIVGTIVYGIHLYWPVIEPLIALDMNLVSTMVIFYGITTIASFVYLGYKYSRGRLWLNLLTAFILQILAILTVLNYNALFYVAAMVSGFIVGMLYLVLRAPRMKKHPDVELPLLNKEIQKRTEQLLSNAELKYMYLPENSSDLVGHYLAWGTNAVYLVNVVRPSKSFTVTSHGIQYDDTDLIPLMESSLLSVAAEKKHIPEKVVIPVVLVLSGFQNLQPVMSVNVSKWKQPDHLLGVTNILTEKGFTRFMKASNDKIKPFNDKIQKKVSSFVQNLTA